MYLKTRPLQIDMTFYTCYWNFFFYFMEYLVWFYFIRVLDNKRESKASIWTKWSSICQPVFTRHRTIPMIAFHGIESIYIYVYVCITYMLYTLLKKLCYSRGLGLAWHVNERALKLQQKRRMNSACGICNYSKIHTRTVRSIYEERKNK